MIESKKGVIESKKGVIESDVILLSIPHLKKRSSARPKMEGCNVNLAG